MSQPNVLFLYSDQHRYDSLGGNGHPVVRTPTLDALAAEGANFSHTFTPTPICVPARCCLLTGAWPWRHGTINNFDSECYKPLDESLPMVPALLRRAGYFTAHVGRWHVKPKSSADQESFGFETAVPDWRYNSWRQEQGLPPRPRPENFYLGGVDPHITPEQSFLAWEADRTIEMLRTAAAGNRPFHIEWHTLAPHLPNILPEPYASMYPPETIPPWPGFADSLAGKPYIQAQQQRTWKLDGWTWERWAPVVARYLGSISLYDAQIARVLTALDELGLAENTIVIYTSDHGDMCGSHGMIDKHHIMYDDVVRVPMIVRFPGRAPAGGACDEFLINSLDLPATFLELAGVDRPESFAGRSILAAVDGRDPAPRQDVYATYSGNQFSSCTQRMVRSRRWKYVWNAAGEDELYDLDNDPGELTNLATASEHASQLKRLRHRLVEWMEQVEDPMLNNWTRAQLLEGLTI
jgi:arylsulfatase A-like enzyme